MARELHVYLDESGRRIDHGQVLLVGALVLQEPLGFRSGAWFTDLLEHPHATEIPNDQIDQRGRKQARVLRAIVEKRVPGLGFSVLALQVARDGGKPLASHYESAYLGLVMELISREGLGREDRLILYPERFSGGGVDALKGRFQGIAGALRWLSPRAEDTPEIAVHGFPKTPDVLIGQSMVDAVLWNLGRGLFESGQDHWPEDLAQQWRRLDLDDHDHLHLSFAPDLHDARGLSQWAARRTGRLEAVDWEEVARRSDVVDFERLARAWEGHADIGGELERALRELEGFAENASIARQGGITMAGLVMVLEALGVGSAALPAGGTRATLERRRQYLLSRAQAHRGEAAAAVDAWAAWNESASSLPLTPSLLEERILGKNALSVLLTDYEAWPAVERHVAESRALIERHRPGYDRDPLLGRCLGALAQARILAGATDDEIGPLLDRSQAQFDGPDDWSYAWSWGLVALGRGAPCPDPTVRLDRILAEVSASHGDDLPGLLSAGGQPFLAWGVAEAATSPSLAAHLGRPWRAALAARARVLVAERDRFHPGIATLRAVAIREKDPSLFSAAWGASRSHASDPEDLAQKLGTGHGLVRLALRTVPAWLVHAPTPEARDALSSLGTACQRVLDADGVALPGLRARLGAVASLDAEDADGARRVLAMGGY